MAKQIGSVSVAITGDNDDLESKLKQSGKDVKKFDDKTQKITKDNSKAWAKWAKKVRSEVSGIKEPLTKVAQGVGVVSAGLAAGSAAFLAFANSISTSNRELETLSRQSNMSAEDFRALSFATGTVGVDADQVSGQLEDMRRKLAEFGKVGTGAFQDYADIMNLNATEAKALAVELSNLSGQDALQKLVNNMQAANVPMSEMGFVLDSLGSDMDRLIPLFVAGGASVKKLTSDFKGLTTTIDKDDIAAFEDLARNMGIASENFKTFLTEALAPLAPAFSDASKSIAQFFKTLTEESRKSGAVAENMERIKDAIGGNEKGQKQFNADAQTTLKLTERQVILQKQLNEEYKATYSSGIDGTRAMLLETESQFNLNKAIAQQEFNQNEILINQLTAKSKAAKEVQTILAENVAIMSDEIAVGDGGKKTPKVDGDDGSGGGTDIVAFTTEQTNQFISALRERMKLAADVLQESYDLEMQMLDAAATNGSIKQEEANQRKATLEQEYWNNKMLLNSENAILAEEMTAEAENTRFENFKAALDEELFTQEAHNALMLKAEKDHAKRLSKIESKSKKERVMSTKEMLGLMAGMMNSGNKTLFEIGKAAAVSSALIDAKTSIVSAYKGGLAYSGGNIAVGAAWATAAGVAQAANVASIYSQSYGGGGSPTSYSGGVPSVNTTQTPQVSQQTAQAAPAQQVNITLVGDTQSTTSIRELMEEINEQLGDGLTLTTD